MSASIGFSVQPEIEMVATSVDLATTKYLIHSQTETNDQSENDFLLFPDYSLLELKSAPQLLLPSSAIFPTRC